MPIRMRINKDSESVCKTCGDDRDNVVEMFDIALTDKHRITICDRCMNELLDKSLHMVCGVNHKVKSPKDMRVIRRRHNKDLW